MGTHGKWDELLRGTIKTNMLCAFVAFVRFSRRRIESRTLLTKRGQRDHRAEAASEAAELVNRGPGNDVARRRRRRGQRFRRAAMSVHVAAGTEYGVTEMRHVESGLTAMNILVAGRFRSQLEGRGVT